MRTIGGTCLAAALAAAACGGGGGPSGGGGTVGTGGVSGAGTGGMTSGGVSGTGGAAGASGAPGAMMVGACDVPSSATILLPPTNLSKSPVYDMTADGGTLFFTTVDTLWSLSSGPPARVYPPADSMDKPLVPTFWLRPSDVVLATDSRTIIVVPRAGGAATSTRQLPFQASGALDGRKDLILDGDGVTLYGKSEEGGFGSGQPRTSSFHRFNLETGSSADLLSGAMVGYGKTVVRSGAFLYTAGGTGDPADITTPNTLNRVPLAGGAAEPLPLATQLRFNVAGADDSHLFLAGAPLPAGSGMGGVYRVPLAGGTPELLIEAAVLFNLNVDVVSLPTRILIRVGYNYYKLAHGGGMPALLFTAARNTGCSAHALAAAGNDVFASVYESSPRNVIIFVVTAP